MKFKLLFWLMAIAFPGFSFGIGSAYDGLTKGGEEYLLAMDIMGDFGQKSIWTKKGMYPDLDKEKRITCLNGLREFACNWEIIHDSLFLSKVTLLKDNMPEADLERMFGRKCKDGKVFAYWVNGEFEAYDNRIDAGKFLFERTHGGMFKVQVVWGVKDGKITQWKRYEHLRNQISQLDLDQKALEKYLANELDWSFFPPREEFPVGISIRLYFDSDSLGEVKNVEVQCEESEYPLQDFSARIKRIMEGINDWTIQYDRGEFVSRRYDKRVFLNRERMPINP